MASTSIIDLVHTIVNIQSFREFSSDINIALILKIESISVDGVKVNISNCILA